jgi:hypothetical protein
VFPSPRACTSFKVGPCPVSWLYADWYKHCSCVVTVIISMYEPSFTKHLSVIFHSQKLVLRHLINPITERVFSAEIPGSCSVRGERSFTIQDV